MKHILFAALAVQCVSLIRPLTGAAFYLASRASFDEQRRAVAVALMEWT